MSHGKKSQNFDEILAPSLNAIFALTRKKADRSVVKSLILEKKHVHTMCQYVDSFSFRRIPTPGKKTDF